MRILLLFLFCWTSFLSLQAQTITKQEALTIAQQLQDREILSEKGKQKLLLALEKDQLSNNYEDYQRAILYHLVKAFSSEFYYRSGINEQTRLQKELADSIPFPAPSKMPPNLSPEELELQLSKDEKKQEAWFLEVQKIVEERMKNFKGYLLEENIEAEEWPAEDSLMTYSIHLNGMPGSYEEIELIHNNRSAIGRTRYSTLKDLLQLKLIDKKVYEDVWRSLKSREVFFEYAMMELCLRRVDYYKSYAANKAQQFQQLETLHQAQLITRKDLATIKASYQPWELQQKFDWLPYCKNALTFDLKQYPTDPLKAYPLFFEEMKKIIPNFDYKNLKIKLLKEEESYSELIEVKLQISFELEEKKYTSVQFYNFIRKGETADSTLGTITGIQTIVNKVLLERNAPERLYYANKRGETAAYGEPYFGLILLTQEEYQAWGGFDAFFLSQENHDNSLNRSNIQKIIQEFQKIGLFDHLTAAEIAQAQQDINNHSISSYAELLLHFPKTILYFDWETGNLKNPYEELTQEIAAISRGQFTPKHIVDNFENSWEQPTTPFAFKFRGKKYKAQLMMDNDWLDPAFMRLIGLALEEQQVDGKLYPCIDDGQAGGYIFLSQQHHQWIEKNYPKLLMNFWD